MILRPPQAEAVAAIDSAWAAGRRNVLLVSATGSGKTVMFSHILARPGVVGVAIAHRQEIVAQISLALARNGVRHRIIGAASAIKTAISWHMEELRISYYDPNARCAVAGIDTLIRMNTSDPWLPQVNLWVMDEAHHLLRGNKWGSGAEMFPNARGLGVTATPNRADGRGLGSHADGVMDHMVVARGMRELINDGYLTDYRIFAPPSKVDLSAVPTSASGDFSPEPLRAAVHAAHITGDVVAHYLRIAAGKLGVTFTVDIEEATNIAAAYRAAGVPAEVVSSKTPDVMRAAILRRFRRRELLQLVNVDLFGEGFDLPAIEVVSMARPTQSFPLYSQQFGRALRPMEGKDRAIIIDHVNNTLRHGLPDAPRRWTLDRRERRGRGSPVDVMPIRVCMEVNAAGIVCMSPYERHLDACPVCGCAPTPAARSAPATVDGDLYELDPNVLRRLRGEVDAVDRDVPLMPVNATPEVRGAIIKRHGERREAQASLRAAMDLYGGWQRALGRSDREAMRRFYLTFGVDTLSARALGRPEAEALRSRVQSLLDQEGVVAHEP